MEDFVYWLDAYGDIEESIGSNHTHCQNYCDCWELHDKRDNILLKLKVAFKDAVKQAMEDLKNE